MSVGVLIGLGLLGGVGAVLRFLLDRGVSARTGREFPYGTLAVNLVGSLALGVLAGAAVGGDAYRLSATGLIGAFTTFSTWSFESHRLAEEGRAGHGALNLLISLAFGLGAVWLGRRLGAGL